MPFGTFPSQLGRVLHVTSGKTLTTSLFRELLEVADIDGGTPRAHWAPRATLDAIRYRVPFVSGSASPTQPRRHVDEGSGKTPSSALARQGLHVFDCAIEATTVWTPRSALDIVVSRLPVMAFSTLPKQLRCASFAAQGQALPTMPPGESLRTFDGCRVAFHRSNSSQRVIQRVN